MPDKTYSIDIHDFGLLLPGLDDLLRIKQHYDNFKITCFTIPLPKEFFAPENQKHFNKEKYEKWAKIINSYDWIEIAMHGFSHTYNEFNCKYQQAELSLKAAENLWDEVGLKYKKLFCAPYWQYSYDALHALKDRGYTVALDRNYPIGIPEGTKTYIYNWDISEPLSKEINEITGHGHAYHTDGSKNAIGDCYNNIINSIPAGANFKFVSEKGQK